MVAGHVRGLGTRMSGPRVWPSNQVEPATSDLIRGNHPNYSSQGETEEDPRRRQRLVAVERKTFSKFFQVVEGMIIIRIIKLVGRSKRLRRQN